MKVLLTKLLAAAILVSFFAATSPALARNDNPGIAPINS
jgi:hypothetical protein